MHTVFSAHLFDAEVVETLFHVVELVLCHRYTVHVTTLIERNKLSLHGVQVLKEGLKTQKILKVAQHLPVES